MTKPIYNGYRIKLLLAVQDEQCFWRAFEFGADEKEDAMRLFYILSRKSEEGGVQFVNLVTIKEDEQEKG